MVSVIEEQKNILSQNEIKAFVSLLKDSEEKTLDLMAQQLESFDEQTIKAIQAEATEQNDEELIDNWYYASKLHLKKQIQHWKGKANLEQGLFILARLKDPGTDMERYSSVLDAYARRVAESVTSTSTHEEIIHAINIVLFKQEGFIGNQIDYYDLNNNFIHNVLEFKTGNPIMLSSLYILIGRRLGLDIQGVGTPGHFIIKFGDAYYDPFFGGREISKDECILRAQELNVNWHEDYLEPIDDNFIISRCIRNLVSIYKKQNEFDKAAEISSLLKLV